MSKGGSVNGPAKRPMSISFCTNCLVMDKLDLTLVALRCIIQLGVP